MIKQLNSLIAILEKSEEVIMDARSSFSHVKQETLEIHDEISRLRCLLNDYVYLIEKKEK